MQAAYRTRFFQFDDMSRPAIKRKRGAAFRGVQGFCKSSVIALAVEGTEVIVAGSHNQSGTPFSLFGKDTPVCEDAGIIGQRAVVHPNTNVVEELIIDIEIPFTVIGFFGNPPRREQKSVGFLRPC